MRYKQATAEARAREGLRVLLSDILKFLAVFQVAAVFTTSVYIKKYNVENTALENQSTVAFQGDEEYWNNLRKDWDELFRPVISG